MRRRQRLEVRRQDDCNGSLHALDAIKAVPASLGVCGATRGVNARDRTQFVTIAYIPRTSVLLECGADGDAVVDAAQARTCAQPSLLSDSNYGDATAGAHSAQREYA